MISFFGNNFCQVDGAPLCVAAVRWGGCERGDTGWVWGKEEEEGGAQRAAAA